MLSLVPAAPSCPTAADVAVASTPVTEWSNELLVQQCLGGNQYAWEMLFAKYKPLICSFPRKYGATAEDTADVFQLVCADLFVALPRLRNHDSVRAWICTVANHRAYHWKRRHVINVRRATAMESEATSVVAPAGRLMQDESEQRVRDAVARLSNPHRSVIELLFFEQPPLPYSEVADRLGIAPGSVSFLRARSLRLLARMLHEPVLE